MDHVLQPGEHYTFRLGFQDRPGRVSVTHTGRDEDLWLRDFKLGNVTVQQGDQPLALAASSGRRRKARNARDHEQGLGGDDRFRDGSSWVSSVAVNRAERYVEEWRWLSIARPPSI
jgi:hypothetical protein